MSHNDSEKIPYGEKMQTFLKRKKEILLYAALLLISFLYSLSLHPISGIVFTGLFFLFGLFIYSKYRSPHSLFSLWIGNKKTSSQIALTFLLFFCAFLLPSLLTGLLIGMPTALQIRSAMDTIKKEMI